MLVFGNGFKLTSKGKQMVSSGASYSFSKIVLGAGTYTSAEDATTRTALKAQKQSFDVSDTAIDGSTVTIAGVITNASLAVGYTITEAGVIAKDSTGAEHLFLIGVATLSDPMPAHSDNIPDVICDMKIKYTTSNTSKVSLSVPETAYARAVDLKAVNSQLAQIATSVKQFGATGDGITNDTESILTAISYCKSHNISSLFFPYGTYIVDSSLLIDFPLNIYGSSRTNNAYLYGTIIKYVNPSDEPLFIFSGTTGGSLHNLTLRGTGLHDAIKTISTGWDNSFYNLYIANFTGSALVINQDDGYFDNIFINTCGSGRTVSKDNVRYAILIGSEYPSNALHFNNIHVEHCQYMLDQKQGYLINFNNCKFEQSYSRFGSELSPCILLEKELGISFNLCMFISINPLAFLYYDKNIKISELPYFIHCTSNVYSYGAIKLTGCTLTTGDGSGSAIIPFMTNECLAIKSDGVPLVLTGNTFSYLATYAPAIIDNGKSSISGNAFHSIVRNYQGILNSDNVEISEFLNSLAIQGLTFKSKSVVMCNRFYHDTRNNPDVSSGRIKYILDSQNAFCIGNIADGGYDTDRYFYKDISTSRNSSISYLDKGNMTYGGDYTNLALGSFYFSTGYDAFRYRDSSGTRSLLNNVKAKFTPTSPAGVTEDNVLFFDALDGNKPKVKINGLIFTIQLNS